MTLDDVAAMDVIYHRGELLSGSEVTLHNREDPCPYTPENIEITDLATATVDVNVSLCWHCTWPDGAKAIVRRGG